jgi:hypothetical protein
MYVLMYIQYKIVYIYIIGYRFRYLLEKLAQLTASHAQSQATGGRWKASGNQKLHLSGEASAPIWGFPQMEVPQ